MVTEEGYNHAEREEAVRSLQEALYTVQGVAKVNRSIDSALSNVGQTFTVVFLVILLFLGWRAALVIAVIVPISVSIALVGMAFPGISIEKISIAAVIIPLGLLVDNGLVVIDDIE